MRSTCIGYRQRIYFYRTCRCGRAAKCICGCYVVGICVRRVRIGPWPIGYIGWVEVAAAPAIADGLAPHRLHYPSALHCPPLPAHHSVAPLALMPELKVLLPTFTVTWSEAVSRWYLLPVRIGLIGYDALYIQDWILSRMIIPCPVTRHIYSPVSRPSPSGCRLCRYPSVPIPAGFFRTRIRRRMGVYAYRCTRYA